jgi:hypothetical protein
LDHQIVKKIEIPKEGISDVIIRADKKLFATAGWDHK